jgi:hypothetical protein
MGRFDYVKYDEDAVEDSARFKNQCENLELDIGLIGHSIDLDGKAQIARYRALALTALEEVFMWIGKALREDQIKRNVRDGVKTPLQEERKDG